MGVHPFGFVAGVIGYFLAPTIWFSLKVLIIGALIVMVAKDHHAGAKLGGMAVVNMVSGKEVYPLPMLLDDLRRGVKVQSLMTQVDRENHVTDRYFIFINTATLRNTSGRQITALEAKCTYISTHDGQKKSVTAQPIPIDIRPGETKAITFEVRSDKLHDGGRGYVDQHFCQITEFAEFDQWPWVSSSMRSGWEVSWF